MLKRLGLSSDQLRVLTAPGWIQVPDRLQASAPVHFERRQTTASKMYPLGASSSDARYAQGSR
jgi:hypothetical protein